MPKFYCEGAKFTPPTCDYSADERWLGKCPGCNRFYNIVRSSPGAGRKRLTLADAMNAKPVEHIATGVAALDHVLNGGIVLGDCVLCGGPRGTGKTTMLMQAVAGFSERTGHPSMYASGEQQTAELIEVAQRQKVFNEKVVPIGNIDNIREIVQEAEDMKVKLLVVDSLQTVAFEDVDADFGSVTQVTAVANFVTSWGKRKNVASIVVGHINQMGNFAGGERLQHIVDTLMFFEPWSKVDDGEDGDGSLIADPKFVRRLSIVDKNRHGPIDVEAFLEMSGEGVIRPLSKLLSRRLVLV